MRYSYEIQYKSIYVQPIRFVISKKKRKNRRKFYILPIDYRWNATKTTARTFI